MGKNPNTFAKRQREMEKRRKAEDKRNRRRERKDLPDTPAHEIAIAAEDGAEDELADGPEGTTREVDATERSGSTP